MPLLRASDETCFRISSKLMKHSDLLRHLIQDDDTSTTDSIKVIGPLEGEEAIPISNVTGPVLEKVIAWLEYHQNDPLDKDDHKEFKASDWDKKFIDVEQHTLFEIILAANYLNIRNLLDLGCQTVAKLMEGKSNDELHQMFDFKDEVMTTE